MNRHQFTISYLTLVLGLLLFVGASLLTGVLMTGSTGTDAGNAFTKSIVVAAYGISIMCLSTGLKSKEPTMRIVWIGAFVALAGFLMLLASSYVYLWPTNI